MRRHIVTATVTLGLALLLGSVPCAAQLVTSQPLLVEPGAGMDARDDERVRLASDGTYTLAVWKADGPPAQRDIAYAYFEPGVGWSPSFIANTTRTDSLFEVKPDIAISGDVSLMPPAPNTFVNVAWERFWPGTTTWNDGDITVSWTTFPTSGSTPLWAPEARPTVDYWTNALSDMAPVIAADNHGNVMVAWWVYDGEGTTIGGQTAIRASISHDNGISWNYPTATDSRDQWVEYGSASQPSIATDGNGVFKIVWRGPGPPPNGGAAIWCRTYYAPPHPMAGTYDPPVGNGLPNPAERVDSDFTGTRGKGQPQIAADGHGNWMVAWPETAPAPDIDWQIAASRYSEARLLPQGTMPAWTPTTLIASDPSVYELHPAIACDGFAPDPPADPQNPDPVKETRASWVVTYSAYAPGTEADIYMTRSADLGQGWSAPALVNTTGATDTEQDSWPDVVYSGFGKWRFAWSTYDAAGSDHDLYWARARGAHEHARLNFTASNPTPMDLQLEFTNSGFPPNRPYFICITSNAGLYPNGLWFGIDPDPILEFIPQSMSGVAPFQGTLDASGSSTWSTTIPGVAGPLGASVYAVTITLNTANQIGVLSRAIEVEF